MTTFNELGLSPKLLNAISAAGYETPTPIQEQGIPLVLLGHDLMGLAQTGTGKTAAFGLPLVQKLMDENIKPKPKSVRALILAPTRELANQISDNLRRYVKKTPIWVSTVIGGTSINTQARNLQRGTDILVATPGRLLDLADRKAVFLDTATFLVLDEADQMLDLGFIHSLRKLSKLLGTPRQTLLFSATMPKQVEDLSKAFLNDPVRVEVSPPGKAADKITQSVHHVSARAKTDLLKQCLIERRDDVSLVFARTKHGAEKLMKHLVDCGFKADSIHGNKSQGQRDRAIRAFKKREIDILVATDVAARGIDIPGVSHVYNFNLPEVPENYVHRIGRTARAGADGQAIAFCAPDEFHLLKAIEKLMGISIRIAGGSEPESMPPKKSGSRARGKPASRKPRARRDKSPSRKAPTENNEVGNTREQQPKQSNKSGYQGKKKRANQEKRPQDSRPEKREPESIDGRFDPKKSKSGKKPWRTKKSNSDARSRKKGEKLEKNNLTSKPKRNKKRRKAPQNA